MTRKEAFLTAVRGETPDQVPVAPLIYNRFANTMLGRGTWKDVFELHQRLGSTDFRGMHSVSVATQLPDTYRRQSTETQGPDGRHILDEVLSTPKGELRSQTVWGMIPHDPMVNKKVIYDVKEREDWDIYRDYVETALAGPYEIDTSSAREHWEYMGEDGVASIAMSCPFTEIGNVRGLEEILLDLYDYPDLLHEIFDLVGRLRARRLEGFLQAPNEVLYYDICWATGSGMSPQMFEEWILPDLVETCEIVHSQPGKYVGFYTLGRIRNYLPMMVESGPDYIETFEQNEGDITLAEAKQQYPGKFCPMGNFDCLVLAFGTVQQARAEALRCLEEAMAGGGYVMVTADEVPADAQWDNLVAMVETVAEHGRYE